MKKILTFFLAIFLGSLTTNAQTNCICPEHFFIRDSINCAFAELHQAAPDPTYSNTDSTAIRVCQFSTMKYSIMAYGPGNCSFPTLQVDTVVALGGTVVNYTNSTFTIAWGGSSTGTVQIHFSIPGGGAGTQGCSGIITLHFKLLPNPIAAFSASPNPACFNNPTNITFNSSASVGALSYFWNFGDGFTSTSANPTHAYTQPGTYTVCLTVSNTPGGGSGAVNGNPGGSCPSCSDSVCQTVVINNLPGPDITCIATVCAGESGTYCTSASCSTYNWVVTGGVITSGLNSPCITVLWGSGNPQGNIHLDVPGCPGFCSQGTDITVPIIPNSTTIAGASVVCLGTTSAYSLPAFPGTTYSWSISGGQLINGNNTNTTSITTTWNTIGTYTVTCVYFDTALNCGGTGTIVVNVLPELKISGPKVRCAGQNSTLHSFNSVTNVNVNCNWTISPAGATVTGGNGTSFATINWANAGTYVVTATPTSGGQVCGPFSYTVIVFPIPVLSSINGPDSICAGGVSVYSATSNQAGLFNWTITGGTGVNMGPNNDSVQITWNMTGPYSITVTQNSYANNCPSLPLTKTVYAYPNPNLTGPTNVCADDTVTYTVTNIGSQGFNWYITPAQFGTLVNITGNTVDIKWHGNNNPGGSNTVYLHYGLCNDDSIAITINEPIAPVISVSGALCTPGITLTSSGTGTFSWSHIEAPPYSSGTSTLTNVNHPGHYVVQIQNYNGTGCTVSQVVNIPDIGRPVAQISPSGPFVYCITSLPGAPNINLSAVTGGGYSYQWLVNSTNIPGATNPTYNVNSGVVNGIGSFVFQCQVTLGNCVVLSNPSTFAVVDTPCPPPPDPCLADFSITNIAGCNPFTVTLGGFLPSGSSLVPGSVSIYHYDDGSTIIGNTTKSFTSIGMKQIRVCASILKPDLTVCQICKDTFVNVELASSFLAFKNCNIITLTDQSNVVAPSTITNYSWSVTPSGSFTNNAIPSPVLTVSSSGTYTITLTVTSSSGCVTSSSQVVNVSVPDADFTVSNSCVGTNVPFNNLFPAPTNYWNFGDATSSNSSPTVHAYASANTYTVTHIVTDIFGCKDTVSKPITIVAAPVCNIIVTGLTTFCSGDSVQLKACVGYSSYQWLNNGNAIAGATNSIYYATQTGNYSFTAVNPAGCDVQSDTVSVTVLQSPSTVFNTTGKACAGENYSVSVPSCTGCFYQWEVNGNVEQAGPSSTFSGIVGNAPLLVGTHLIKVTITGSNGCVSTDSFTVTFNPQPTVSISVAGNPSQLCGGITYVFNASTNAASPSWAWSLSGVNAILSTTYSLTASAAGLYTVLVTDGITGCTNSASQFISESPDLSLFPQGCDTLCQNTSVFVPLPSLNGNISGYTINWYDNAPPYTPITGTGVSLNLNSLSLGSHNLSVIVIGPNGCADTSNAYNIYVVPSTSSNTSATACGSYTWAVNGQTYTISGTYTSSTLNANGCPQYDTLQLVISTSTSTNTTINSCGPYTWPVNGVTYTSSGVYTHTSMVNGCLQTDILNLTITIGAGSSITITACNSYTWPANGVTYTLSGTYTHTVLDPATGCLQADTLNLVINHDIDDVTNATACASYTWAANGTTYTASGTYTFTTAIAGGCVHYYILNLVINNTGTTSTTSATACNSYTWAVNGVTYTASGTYIHTVLDPATGCLQTDTLNLVINHDIDDMTNATACASYTWAANGTTYTASGTYTFTTAIAGGCVHYYILNLVINNTGTTSTSSATACTSYTWAVNGVTYTASGTYTYTQQNAEGCVNTWILHLTIGEGGNNVQVAVACDVYTWTVNGQTYTASGTYTHTMLNAAGCVVTYTLVLTINTTTVSTTNATACGSYTWTQNGVTYTLSGTYTYTVIGANGCLHVYALCLVIFPNTSSSQSATACGPYNWAVNGQTYTASGTYTATTLNANGCIHTTTLTLTIQAPTTSSVSATACGSYTWPLNGVTYTASGTYTFTQLNTVGCPHVTTLNLTIHQPSSSTQTVIACDSYTWFGVTYTASGVYTHTSLNTNGCLHTSTLNLTINTSTIVTLYATACGSYTWTQNGVTYTASGTYTVLTIGPNGCPKLYVLCLVIYPNTNTVTNATACNSYTWTANGQTYTASGTYTYTSLTANGCLNTATLNLVINQSSSSSTTATACNSYVWTVNGQTYTASGIYTHTYLNTQGCPHTATLNLTIYPSTNTTTTITACDEYYWPVNGVIYTVSGTYTHTITNAGGCVSTATLILVLHHSTQSTVSATTCDSYTWNANGVTYTASGTYTHTFMNTEGCPHTAILVLTINHSSSSSVSVYACEAYTWPENGVTYTASGTYTYTYLNQNGCVHTATLILTIGSTQITHIFDTACCSYTWTMNGVTYTESGIYSIITIGPDGCPHFYILCVTIYPCTPITTQITACGSYTWPVNGVTYTTSGTYTHTGINPYGCPVIYTLHVSIGQGPGPTTYSCDTVCNSYYWPVNGVTYTLSGSYSYIGYDAYGCPHVYILCVCIKHSSDTVIHETATNSYTWAVTGITYTTSGMYTGVIVLPNGCDSIIHLDLTIVLQPVNMNLAARAMLHGPYKAAQGLMADSLRVLNLLPFTEPYSGPPLFKPQLMGSGGETTNAAVLGVSGNNAIVDWVYIEIRDGVNCNTVLATKNALIQRDGDIVSPADGVSPLTISGLVPGNYYIAVKHRNHLGVMCATPVTLSAGGPAVVDFTSIPLWTNPSITSNAAANFTGTIQVMWCGDPNYNKNIKYNGIYNDKDPILMTVGYATPNNTVYGYRLEDVNMDGKVRFNNTDNDRSIILSVVGVSTPNKVLSQHTPN